MEENIETLQCRQQEICRHEETPRSQADPQAFASWPTFDKRPFLPEFSCNGRSEDAACILAYDLHDSPLLLDRPTQVMRLFRNANQVPQPFKIYVRETLAQRNADTTEYVDGHLLHPIYRRSQSPTFDNMMKEIIPLFALPTIQMVELHLELPNLCHSRNVLRHLDFLAPRLDSLTILVKGMDDLEAEKEPISRLSHTYLPLPTLPILFRNHAPVLTKLTLNYFTSWVNNFNALSHLCLASLERDTRISLSQFVVFLNSCGPLEELVIVSAAPAMETSNCGSLAGLPHLQRLSLGEMHVDKIRCILGRLRLPQMTCMRLWNADSCQPARPLDGMLPSVSSLANVTSVTKLRLYENDEDTYQVFGISPISAFQVVCSRTFAGTSADFELSLLRLKAISDFPLPAIRELWLEGKFPSLADNSPLPSVFGSLPSLTTLVVCCWPLEPILSALSVDQGLCSCLKVFVLYKVNNVTLRQIHQFVEDRSIHGHPLQHLRLGPHQDLPLRVLHGFAHHVELVETIPKHPHLPLPEAIKENRHRYWRRSLGESSRSAPKTG